MLQSYRDSVAPGTLSNRVRQAKLYVKFCVMYNLDPLHPIVTDVCMYAQYLKNIYPSPQTVKNYISGAKTWVADHGGTVLPFMSRELDQITKGFTKNSTHVPHRAAPLTEQHLLLISNYVRSNHSIPTSVLPCIVIGYSCFLRASNLLSPSSQVWGGPHTLLARDIVLCDGYLEISICSTKTKWDNHPEVFTIMERPGHRLCPVALWSSYLRKVRPWLLGPAFLTDNLLPLTARHVVIVMRAALAHAKDLDPGNVSLHSLRRGAAQNAAEQGSSLSHIKSLGLWKSDSGVKPYLDTCSSIFKR